MRFHGLQVAWIAATSFLFAGNTCADFVFGEPVNPGPPLNSPYEELGPSISPDGCTVYFFSDRPNGYGDWDIWVATRPSAHERWSSPANLGPAVNSSAIESFPSISADGLTLYFCRGPKGNADTWVATRDSTDTPWGSAKRLDVPINVTGADDYRPFISDNDLSLFFVSDRPGGYGGWDLWVSTRATANEHWEPPVNLGAPINSPHHESRVVLSFDGSVMLLQSNRPGGGAEVIYMSTRESPGGSWSEPVNLGPVLSGFPMAFISNLPRSGRALYIFDHPSYTPRPGGYGKTDIWHLPIDPVVDFNGDGVVDGADVIIMAAHWGEDYPSGDIGPTPFGDGIVDVQDLIALADYIGEPISDPTLAAHWPLDEAEGVIAHDTTGLNHASVVGDAIWQPDGGKFGGALRCDGFNDCVRSEFTLNPAAQPFSVFVWVKGGAPGQVILSQEFSADWLATDVTGALGTELKGPGRMGQALWSHTVVTDDQWHRVGLVWDGGARILYVDDVKVAVDVQTSLRDSPGGLLIGAGGDLAPGTFWFGPIDEVRVYNRAVRP